VKGDSMKLRATCVVLVTCLTLLLCSAAARHGTPDVPMLQPWEAELIAYLSPAGHRIRESGFDIVVTLEPAGPHRNDHDYWFFWAVSSDKEENAGSTTVAHFAVNKWSGDLWNAVSVEQISTSEIEGVKRILRKVRGIDESDLTQHRDRPLYRK